MMESFVSFVRSRGFENNYLEDPVWKRLNLVMDPWSDDPDIRRVYGGWLVEDGVEVKWWPWFRAGAGNVGDAKDFTISLRLERALMANRGFSVSNTKDTIRLGIKGVNVTDTSQFQNPVANTKISNGSSKRLPTN